MVDFELEKQYTTQEVADGLGIAYGTFRNNRQEYEEKLSKGYEWEYVKRKYIFHKKKEDIYRRNSKEIYDEIYLPAVIEAIGKNPWNTAAGVTNEIWAEGIVDKVEHLMTTAYNYVCKALGSEYDITERKYAACMGKGVYPRFMTDEEIKAWNELKSKYAKETSERIMELTEKWVNKVIKTVDYNRQLKELASGSFV